MINVDKVSEDIHYELIPVEYVDNDAAWDVRILRGEFTETVIRFGTISFDGESENLRFDFRVVESPSDATSEVVELQEFAADILEDIIENGIRDGKVVTRDRDNGEQIARDTSGTNDTEKLTD